MVSQPASSLSVPHYGKCLSSGSANLMKLIMSPLNGVWHRLGVAWRWFFPAHIFRVLYNHIEGIVWSWFLQEGITNTVRQFMKTLQILYARDLFAMNKYFKIVTHLQCTFGWKNVIYSTCKWALKAGASIWIRHAHGPHSLMEEIRSSTKQSSSHGTYFVFKVPLDKECSKCDFSWSRPQS